MNIMMCIMLQNSQCCCQVQELWYICQGVDLPVTVDFKLMLSSDMTHFICICNIILDLSSVTRFGRDQLANICRSYFLTLKKVVSSLLRFFVEAGGAGSSYNTYFCMDFDFFCDI